ncbi:UNVERIFIED_ORG: putative membrane protein [Rhizobium esperanzae]|uniref:DUF2270 domain-containing protein n=1 Tax=Rhizobium phaseoli TaxID=396 RepID=UPI00031D2150|nr:DUF2270 domain-containing protein [Rhizobium phaseoli]KEC73379.1 hypothetical protein RLPCCGM1_c1496 [Rhizobium leguminosarum bv. phaseoli CCGM1]PWI53322.1 hypothetical protein B5K03_12990 [Rhizobium phaseoli]
MDMEQDRMPPASEGEGVRVLLPGTLSEITTSLTHYYRGELGRMTSWRDRIDRTSNWAITVVAALLSVSLSTPTSHHGVLLFGMMLITLLLMIEARRYRFFDIYRARIRQIERCYFAQILAPDPNSGSEWAAVIAGSLRHPRFLLSYGEAMHRRLKRNYGWMYFILLLAWCLKISTPKLQTEGTPALQAHSWAYVIDNAVLGPIPGLAVIAAVVAFYLGMLYFALRPDRDEGEFGHGEAHV